MRKSDIPCEYDDYTIDESKFLKRPRPLDQVMREMREGVNNYNIAKFLDDRGYTLIRVIEKISDKEICCECINWATQQTETIVIYDGQIGKPMPL